MVHVAYTSYCFLVYTSIQVHMYTHTHTYINIHVAFNRVGGEVGDA